MTECLDGRLELTRPVFQPLPMPKRDLVERVAAVIARLHPREFGSERAVLLPTERLPFLASGGHESQTLRSCARAELTAMSSATATIQAKRG